jgi:hypothetical protein
MFGDVDTPAAMGEVNATDNMMARIKQCQTILTGLDIPDDLTGLLTLFGAINNAAAEGAVTDSDTLTAYIKQIVTVLLQFQYDALTYDLELSGAAGDGIDNWPESAGPASGVSVAAVVSQNYDDLQTLLSILGTLAEAAATGAVGTTKTLSGYIKQLVTDLRSALVYLDSIVTDTGTDIPAVLGALNTAAHTGAVGNTTTEMGYLKQLVTDMIILVGVIADGGTAAGAWPAEAFAGTDIGIRQALLYAFNGIRKNGGAALAASKSLVDALGSNGTTLSYGSGSALGAIGTVVVCNTGSALVSSEIKASSEKDLTDIVTGTVLVEDIILETDLTGIAAGANIEIKTTSGFGPATVCSEAVANLGANVRVSMKAASVIPLVPFTMAGTDKLTIGCSGIDCTGAGVLRITIIARRQTDGALIAIPSTL